MDNETDKKIIPHPLTSAILPGCVMQGFWMTGLVKGNSIFSFYSYLFFASIVKKAQEGVAPLQDAATVCGYPFLSGAASFN